jgi:hypothetical protein
VHGRSAAIPNAAPSMMSPTARWISARYAFLIYRRDLSVRVRLENVTLVLYVVIRSDSLNCWCLLYVRRT